MARFRIPGNRVPTFVFLIDAKKEGIGKFLGSLGNGHALSPWPLPLRVRFYTRQLKSAPPELASLHHLHGARMTSGNRILEMAGVKPVFSGPLLLIVENDEEWVTAKLPNDDVIVPPGSAPPSDDNVSPTISQANGPHRQRAIGSSQTAEAPPASLDIGAKMAPVAATGGAGRCFFSKDETDIGFTCHG
eukprot:jgi/Mesvir1/17828/Mv12920-RA.1